MWEKIKSWLGFGNTNIEQIDTMKKFLVVGLGNIGEKYAYTRHNIGFQILDFLATKEEISFETAKLGDISKLKVKGRTILLLKPSTFMNLSGKSVKYWLTKDQFSCRVAAVACSRSFCIF